MPAMLKNFPTILVLAFTITACQKNDPIPFAPPDNNIIETVPSFQRAVTGAINPYIGGYYEAVPNHYQVTSKKYPLLIFLHGAGQLGDGSSQLPLVLNDGVAKEINARKFPANFIVSGNNFSFIVLSPQFNNYPPDSAVKSFIDFAIKHYRVDSSRIYLSGLSMGGILTTELAGLYPSLFAAVAPIAGESFGANRDLNAANIARGKLALWVFHNADDPSVPSVDATNFISLVNSYNPGVIPKLTLFPAYGHDAWTTALDPSYKENNMNVYEWMLQFKR